MFRVNWSADGGSTAIISFHGVAESSQWPAYARTYTEILKRPRLGRLLIVFDCSELASDLNSLLDFILAKKDLTASLKPYSCRVLQAVIIVTPTPEITKAAKALMACCGQTAPCFFFDSMRDAAPTIQYLQTLVRHKPGTAFSKALCCVPAAVAATHPSAYRVKKWTPIMKFIGLLAALRHVSSQPKPV